jgi:uncharacterized protein YjbJ (UPF0337 family)
VTQVRKKAQARTKQIVGQVIGDDQLVLEGQEEQRTADHEETAQTLPKKQDD